jgi:hypothetical protein
MIIGRLLESQLHENPTNVRLDGFRTQEKGGADTVIGSTFRNQ